MYLATLSVCGEELKEFFIDVDSKDKVQEWINGNIEKLMKGFKGKEMLREDDEEGIPVDIEVHEFDDMEKDSEYWKNRIIIQRASERETYIVTDTKFNVVMKFRKHDSFSGKERFTYLYDGLSSEQKRICRYAIRMYTLTFHDDLI